jgi:hypothetical protein
MLLFILLSYILTINALPILSSKDNNINNNGAHEIFSYIILFSITVLIIMLNNIL